jgi:enoyl-CoA hydratase/carnithine racemase
VASSATLRRVTTDGIHLSADGELAVLRLSDGKANAMSAAMLGALADAVASAGTSGARGLVIHGEGKTFSAGLALPELIELDRATLGPFMEHFAATMRAVLECPLPTVIAINGHAIAGGCVLALMGDVRLMTTAPAKIGLSEVQLSIGLPSIVVEPLRARVPASSLGPIALEGTLFDPPGALRIGLVDELIEPGELVDRARARARAMTSAGSAAYAQVKRALLRPVLAAFERHDPLERDAWLDTWFSADAQAKLRAAVARLAR